MKKITIAILLLGVMYTTSGQNRVSSSKNTKDNDTIQVNRLRKRNIAQTEVPPLMNQDIIHSPDVASLIRKVQYPVNYSTGVVNIQIPLYEIRCGELKLPITLAYHASGIKLSDDSGWVGLGWTIEAEPMISHVIKGYSDESSKMKCDFNVSPERTNMQRHYISLGHPDEQPDEYYYRLSEKSGMFMYALEPQHTQTSFVPFPYENLKIEWNGHFKITDDDGTIYDFGGSIDKSNRFGQNINYSDGWRASSIVSANYCDTILFTYDSNVSRYTFKQHADNVVVIDNFQRRANLRETNRYYLGESLEETCMRSPIILNTIGFTTKSYQLDDSGNLISDGYEDTYYPENTGYTQSYHLQTISFKGGLVIFSQSADKKVLEHISVYDTNMNLVKQIDFSYSPRGTYYPKYYLEQITISNGKTTNKEIYKFDYYKKYNFIQLGYKSIDYWGYYNGVIRNENESLVPEQTITAIRDIGSNFYDEEEVELTIGSPKSRESNEMFMVYGSLQKITYPTGASDEFIYEANRKLDSNTNEITQTGGLRIKEMHTITANGKSHLRTFKYGQDECGYGITPIYDSNEYYYNEKTAFYHNPQCGIASGTTLGGDYMEARQRTYYSDPIIPNTFEGGSSVMYDCVTEYHGTPADNIGKTIYTYNINPIKRDSNPWSTIKQDQHIDRLYGQLLTKSIYKNTGNGYKIIEKTENTYSSANKNFGKIHCSEVELTGAIRKSCGYYTDNEKNYSYVRTIIDIVPMLLSSSTHTIYDDGNRHMRETSTYEYNITTQIQPTKETSTCTDGTTYTTSYKYPADYSCSEPYSTMLSKNIVSPIITTIYDRGNGNHLEIQTPYNNIYKPYEKNYRYNNNGSWQTRYTYSYNIWGNKNYESKDNREHIVYLYGYNRQYIIAVIENATYNDVKLKLGETLINSIEKANQPSQSQWNQIESLRISMPDAHITTCKYQPLIGITSIKDAAGHTTSFTYDGLGRLATKKITHNGSEQMIESYNYHYITE